MIDLRRRAGERPLRIGHRGAAALAPENTLRSLRSAVGAGVDLVEFDVLDLPRGPLVLAHSDQLDEVSHGAARGSLRSLTLDEAREIAPELPTLDEAVAFFANEAPHVGIHVDLKLRGRFDELAETLDRHGVSRRTVVSSADVAALRAVGRHAPDVRIGVTYPDDRLGISRRPLLHPLVRLGLSTMRALAPRRIIALAAQADATAVMLQHRLVTREAVARAHAHDLSVLAWTVDEPSELDRVVDAGVDGVITNDPLIFPA